MTVDVFFDSMVVDVFLDQVAVYIFFQHVAADEFWCGMQYFGQVLLD